MGPWIQRRQLGVKWEPNGHRVGFMGRPIVGIGHVKSEWALGLVGVADTRGRRPTANVEKYWCLNLI